MDIIVTNNTLSKKNIGEQVFLNNICVIECFI